MTHTDDYPQDVTNLPHEDATQGAGAGRAINQTWEELREGESEDAALGDPTRIGDEKAADNGFGMTGDEEEEVVVDPENTSKTVFFEGSLL